MIEKDFPCRSPVHTIDLDDLRVMYQPYWIKFGIESYYLEIYTNFFG
jgi:hypothetical protein